MDIRPRSVCLPDQVSWLAAAEGKPDALHRAERLGIDAEGGGAPRDPHRPQLLLLARIANIEPSRAGRSR